jgi:hypothetical protein
MNSHLMISKTFPKQSRTVAGQLKTKLVADKSCSQIIIALTTIKDMTQKSITRSEARGLLNKLNCLESVLVAYV